MFKVGDLVKFRGKNPLKINDSKWYSEAAIRFLNHPPFTVKEIMNNTLALSDGGSQSFAFSASDFEPWETEEDPRYLKYRVGDLVRINYPIHLKHGVILEIKKINSKDFIMSYVVSNKGYYYSDKELESPGDFRVGDHVSTIINGKRYIGKIGEICNPIIGVFWKNSNPGSPGFHNHKANFQHVSSDIEITDYPSGQTLLERNPSPLIRGGAWNDPLNKSEYVSLDIFREQLDHARKESANTRLEKENLSKEYIDEIKKASQSREQLNKKINDLECLNHQHLEQKFALDEKLRFLDSKLLLVNLELKELQKHSELDLMEIELLKKKIPTKTEPKPSLISSLIGNGWAKTQFLGSKLSDVFTDRFREIFHQLSRIMSFFTDSRVWLNTRCFAKDKAFLMIETALFVLLLSVIDFGYLNTVWFQKELDANNVIGPSYIPSPKDPREAALIEKKAMLRKKAETSNWK